ncbi:MAG: glycoside hydrolase family 6 protein [Pseudomonadales bacterium]|nr:glycoside hydrolase family 6 protein [Pseudomonadales bacterium]
MILNKTALAIGITSALVLASCSKSDDANSAPSISSAQLEDGKLVAMATDSDADDNLIYTWSMNGSELGRGESLTPPASAQGKHDVTVVVSDGTESDSYTFEVDFGNGDGDGGEAPPVTDNIAPVVNAGTSVTAVSGTRFYLSGVATDADEGDTLEYIWSVKDQTFDSANASFVIDEVGTWVATLTVSDGTTSTSKSVDVTVTEAGVDPVNSAPSINAGNPMTVVAGQAFILKGLATDSNNDNLVINWNVDGQDYSDLSSIVTLLAKGSFVATLTVSDSVNPAVTDTVLITVIEEGVDPTNTAPTITLAVVSNGSLVAIAADNETDSADLLYTWSVGLTTIGTGTPLPLTAVNTVTGLQTVTLVVSDGSKTATTTVIDVDFGDDPVVIPGNLDPVITSAALVGSSLVAVATDDQSTAALTYTWTIDGIPAATTGATIAAPSGLTGSKTVTVTVTDAGGLSDTDTFTANFGGGDGGGPIVVIDDPAIVIIDQYDGDIDLDEQVIGVKGTSLQTAGNPFADAYFYLNPDISTMIDYSLERVTDDALIQKMKYVQKQPSAIWMDSTATITQAGGDGSRITLLGHLDAALMQQEYYNQKDGGQSPMTVVIIIYNLPDRDCAAFASNGKLIQVGKDDGTVYPADVLGMGYEKYRDEYIAPIAAAFSDPKYASLRIVAMLEPDSFPNMITNTNEGNTNPLLGPQPASLTSGGYCDKILNFNNDTVVPPVTGEGNDDYPNLGLYADSLRLAIQKMHEASLVSNNIYTYMDIGHAGWLGWDVANDVTDDYPGYEDPEYEDGTPDYLQTNMKRGVRYFKQLIDGADGAIDGQGMEWVRGFASNTSGYTPTEEQLISNSMAYLDLKELEPFYQYNPAVDEMTYIDNLNYYFTTEDPDGWFGTQAFAEVGFIIDTARNGWGALGDARPRPGSGTKGLDGDKRVDTRVHRGHWCNVNDAGVGEVPKAAPDAGRPYLDAFFWMKPPGEADGISFRIEDFEEGSAAYAALDDIEKDIVIQSNHPAYAGKTLDTMCIPGEMREDVATTPVPEMSPHAGSWFHYQFIMLLENAYPPLGQSDYLQ